MLRRFKEPAWNFQVIRFLDSEAIDIIPRRDRVWTLAALAERMSGALRASKREIPKTLTDLQQ